MKHQKTITVLTVLIVLLSLIAGIKGILSMGGSGEQVFISLNKEAVHLYGKGVYMNDSVAVAAQAIAQDWVTVLLGVPLLILSCVLIRKNSLRARILLAGTLAYFFYTYMSYCFLSMYNYLFLIYVALMSMSFFALVLVIISFDLQELKNAFSEKLPTKTIGIIIIIFTSAITLMWLKRIVPSLLSGETPPILEHYNTLVIQVLDLGFVIPLSFLSAILLMGRKPVGLLLSSVMCMKAATLLTSLTAMIISQALAGVKMSIFEIIIFPIANIIVFLGVFVFMAKIKEPVDNETK